jgi:hypothetical protein
MAEVDSELIYGILQRVQATLAEQSRTLADLRHEMRDLAAEMREVKAHTGALIAAEARQDGTIADLTLRVERIERRLNLID